MEGGVRGHDVKAGQRDLTCQLCGRRLKRQRGSDTQCSTHTQKSSVAYWERAGGREKILFGVGRQTETSQVEEVDSKVNPKA